MVNSSQPGEGEGARQLHFTLSSLYHHEQSCGAYAAAERGDTLLLFLLYTFLLCGLNIRKGGGGYISE